jgi:MFS family permease
VILRFCLYGLLKNQRYFEPFWILAFLDKGLSFALIGTLIGFREICIAALEVPTGAVADVTGRRHAMILSHVAYIASFLVFAFADAIAWLFVAMFAFAVGEAFRTGTHKAMIFAWLKNEGREGEKTRVYGVTRSWSQIGSAISVVVAAAFVFVLQDYSAIFAISAVPAALNIVNFLTYPKFLDGEREKPGRLREVLAILWKGTLNCFASPALRRPIVESMAYEGMYKSSRDYLQPIVQQMVLAAPILIVFDGSQRTALAIAVVYATLHLFGSFASRYSGSLAERVGGEERASRTLWLAFGLTFAAGLLGTLVGWTGVAIACFIFLSGLQNVWRPILIGRVAHRADEKSMATVLSVESQATSIGIAIVSPLLGLAVDATPDTYRFAPIALFGIALAVTAIVFQPATRPATTEPFPEGRG